MASSLHDLMQAVGVLNHPDWFSEITLPNWPMPHQMDMIKIYPRNVRFGDFSEPGCVSADTEYLTPTGWKRIDQYDGGMVAQFHPDDKSMSFVQPSDYIVSPCEEMFVVKPSRGLNMKLSADHRVLHYTPGGSHYRVDRMDKVAAVHEQQVNGFRGLFCTTAKFSGATRTGLTEAQLRVQVMTLADGSFTAGAGTRCNVRVLKARKKARCRALLESSGIPFKEYAAPQGYTVFNYYSPLRCKTYPSSWWGCSEEERAVILDEARYWDGNEPKKSTRAFRFTSAHKTDVDFIQFCAVTLGVNCTTKHRRTRILGGNEFDEHTALVSSKGLLSGIASSTTKTLISVEPTEDGKMYCFTVPSSFLVLRRKGKVFTTGNCGKTFPAQVHAIFMAAIGNRVVFVTLPALIPQFMKEFEEFFPGIGRRLKIEDLDCSAAHKKKRETRWEVEGWPDILVMSYDIYRLYNDKHPVKNIGNNLWRLRNVNAIGTKEEFSTAYFNADGDPKFPRAQAYTTDGRVINMKRGTAKNTKQMMLRERDYNVMFFDEGDALCGLESILSESVAEMSMRLKDDVAIYIMTGTPIPTKLHNAYGIIRLINPDAYLNKAAFIRQHCEMKEFNIPLPGGKSKKIKEIAGYFDTEKLYESLWKNAHRVQKRDVLDLPEPLISEVPVRLSGAHNKLYRQIVNDRFAVLGDQVLAPDNVSALRHLALQVISCPGQFDPAMSDNSELAKATYQLVQTLKPEPSRKLIIFAFYRRAIEELAKQYAHYKCAVVYGGTADRAAEIEKFQNDDECEVIIIQWVSGGAGLNLQVAGYIIFYECPTSPKAAKQAIARADRKGQKNMVNVFFMRVLKTLSDKNFKSLLTNEESNNRAIKDKHDLLFELLG